ncbi:adrenodoxin [Microcaecilia unicolor]|uniref:Adrenodoxin-like n=1 Tax=Microcaecilia unicolor TaxID=1415580 RepID=A0A6P7YI96_9AMPH|nr:adrenodoxin-like [Microcaecilia unicolor]
MSARCIATLLRRPFLSLRVFPGGQGGPSLARRGLCSGATDDKITVHFINRDGERLTATAKEGQSLLDVVINQNLEIDGFGACEGTLACSTCHLIFEQKIFDQISSITDEEMDMLDLAYGLTNTSRLGCQVCVTKAMDGLTARLPIDVSDARKDAGKGMQGSQ